MSSGLLVKKFISFFFEPIGIVTVLFFIGFYFLYKRKNSKAEFFFLASVFALLLFSYQPFANFLITNLEDRYPKYDYSKKVHYIHVLGHGHTDDPTQPLTSQLTNDGIKRVLEGIIIHKEMPDSKIIFTGYKGKTEIENAVLNAELADALEIGKDEMIVNPKPEDTADEAEFTKSIVGAEPFILVTSASHMPRAMELFRARGMNPIAAPTAFYKEKAIYSKAPNSWALYISEIAMHEYVGIFYAKLKVAFKAVFS